MNIFIFLVLPVSIFCIHEIDPTLTDAEKDRYKRSSIQCNSHSYTLEEFQTGMLAFDRDVIFNPSDEIKKKAEALKILKSKAKVIDCPSRCFFERTSNNLINAGCTDELPGALAKDVYPKMLSEPSRYVCDLSMCNTFLRITVEGASIPIDQRFLSNTILAIAAHKRVLDILETGQTRSEPDTNLRCAKFKKHFAKGQSIRDLRMDTLSEKSNEIDCKAYCFVRESKEYGGVTVDAGCMEGRLSRSFLNNTEKEYLCDRRMCNTGEELAIEGIREHIESDDGMMQVFKTILRKSIEDFNELITLYYTRHRSIKCFKYDVEPTKLPPSNTTNLDMIAGTIHAFAKLKPEEVRCSEGCYTTKIIDGHIYAGCIEEGDPSRQDFVCKQDGCNYPIDVASATLVKEYKKHEVIQLVKGMDDTINFLEQVGNEALRMVHA